MPMLTLKKSELERHLSAKIKNEMREYTELRNQALTKYREWKRTAPKHFKAWVDAHKPTDGSYRAVLINPRIDELDAPHVPDANNNRCIAAQKHLNRLRMTASDKNGNVRISDKDPILDMIDCRLQRS